MIIIINLFGHLGLLNPVQCNENLLNLDLHPDRYLADKGPSNQSSQFLQFVFNIKGQTL